MTARLARSAAAPRERPPITVMSWWDVYPLRETGAQVECPDCEQLSPPADNLYTLVCWVVDHGRECRA